MTSGVFVSVRRRRRNLAGGGWEALTLMEQLANVGSEVERAIRALESEWPQQWEYAFARALELFDLTAADRRWSAPGRRETLRAREQFVAVFFGDDDRRGAATYLRKYFMQFAFAARRNSSRVHRTRIVAEEQAFPSRPS